MIFLNKTHPALGLYIEFFAHPKPKAFSPEEKSVPQKLILETRGFKGALYQTGHFPKQAVRSLFSQNFANMRSAFYFPRVSKLVFC